MHTIDTMSGTESNYTRFSIRYNTHQTIFIFKDFRFNFLFRCIYPTSCKVRIFRFIRRTTSNHGLEEAEKRIESDRCHRDICFIWLAVYSYWRLKCDTHFPLYTIITRYLNAGWVEDEDIKVFGLSASAI